MAIKAGGKDGGSGGGNDGDGGGSGGGGGSGSSHSNYSHFTAEMESHVIWRDELLNELLGWPVPELVHGLKSAYGAFVAHCGL